MHLAKEEQKYFLKETLFIIYNAMFIKKLHDVQGLRNQMLGKWLLKSHYRGSRPPSGGHT